MVNSNQAVDESYCSYPAKSFISIGTIKLEQSNRVKYVTAKQRHHALTLSLMEEHLFV